MYIYFHIINTPQIYLNPLSTKKIVKIYIAIRCVRLLFILYIIFWYFILYASATYPAFIDIYHIKYTRTHTSPQKFNPQCASSIFLFLFACCMRAVVERKVYIRHIFIYATKRKKKSRNIRKTK